MKPTKLVFLFLIIFSKSAYCNETNTLFYDGPITEQNNLKIVLMLKESQGSIDTLNIRSVGGSVQQGIELGYWVINNDLDVRVIDYCMSSCANYVFPAGVGKYLPQNSVLGWHGGASQKLPENQLEEMLSQAWAQLPESQKESNSIAKMRESVLRSRQEIIEKERKYFEALGVEVVSTIIGQECEYYDDISKHPDVNGWYYSIEDMMSLGILNIVQEIGPWSPEDSQYSRKLVAIELSKCGY